MPNKFTTYNDTHGPLISDSAQGVLAIQHLHLLAERNYISADQGLCSNQFQPASIDLRLGQRGWRVRASSLPGQKATVQETLKDLILHEFDISQGMVLEVGCVYVFALMESLNLPHYLTAIANAKSSTGRLDIFARVLSNYNYSFDCIQAGYKGPLYIEISPQSFPILVRSGSRLAQIRFKTKRDGVISDNQLLPSLPSAIAKGNVINDAKNLYVSVNLSLQDKEQSSKRNVNIVGYKAKKNAGLVDIDKAHSYHKEHFWEPITVDVLSGEYLVLDPGTFYILASQEEIQIPFDYAAEMKPFDPFIGEFRVHYAGFFDPGFGVNDKKGSKGVLEVRSHDVPFLLKHGQIVGSLVYEKLIEPSHTVYGSSIGSHYQSQGLKLSKHFF